MKRIECLISDEFDEIVDKLRKPLNQSRAQFNRTAIEEYIKNQLEIQVKLQDKIKKFLNN